MACIYRATAENGITVFRAALEGDSPVVFPTDTIYGIGAPVANVAANKKIVDIKRRKPDAPFPILIGDRSHLSLLVDQAFTPEIDAYIDSVWPGPYTLVMQARKDLDSFFTMNGTVAVRLLGEGWLGDVVREIGPITATSANISGIEYSGHLPEILSIFLDEVGYFLVGKTGNQKSSNIVNISKNSVIIIR